MEALLKIYLAGKVAEMALGMVAVGVAIVLIGFILICEMIGRARKD